MGQWVGCNHENLEERLVNGKEGLSYRMDRNRMNVDRPWEKEYFL